MSHIKLPLSDTRVLDLLDAFGAPYSWGAGGPARALDSWPDGAPGNSGGIGWDCSGFVQAALVRLGVLTLAAPRRNAAALFDLSAPVIGGQERLGDLAFYGVSGISHVTLVIGPGLVLGAIGGGSSTNGDDPRAFVKLDRVAYRPDVRGVRRIPSPSEVA